MVRALLNIIKNQFTKEVVEEPELDVPRHKWVTIHEIPTYLGRRVEVHAANSNLGQTSVVGQLREIEYTSFDGRMRITVVGNNFAATVNLFGNDTIMVHL